MTEKSEREGEIGRGGGCQDEEEEETEDTGEDTSGSQEGGV